MILFINGVACTMNKRPSMEAYDLVPVQPDGSDLVAASAATGNMNVAANVHIGWNGVAAAATGANTVINLSVHGITQSNVAVVTTAFANASAAGSVGV